MKVLVACEESQRVCTAFRERGNEAYSCDIKCPSGGHAEWHILGDALLAVKGGQVITMDGKLHIVNNWDLLIAHPPCTYLSNAGARHLYPKGVLNVARLEKGLLAKEFFMQFYNADVPLIAIENPIPSTIYQLPKYTQIIQPYQFGHPYKKKTCLWLKGLPELKPTVFIRPELCQSTRVCGNWFNCGGKDRQENRAKTFKGIAEAMADQWGSLNGHTDC